jgi:hypothetical protein
MSASGQFVSACDATSTNVTYYSTNYGQTWTASATTATTGGFQGIACSASGQYQVTAIGSSAIYYSSNYGQSWTASNVSNAGGVQGASMSASGQYVIVVTSGSGVWYSSNYGVTFVVTTSGVSTNNIRGSAASASGQYQLATGFTGGMYYSTNYGTSWTLGSSTIGWFGGAMSANGQYCLGCTPGGAVYLSVTRSPPQVLANPNTNSSTGLTVLGPNLLTTTSIGIVLGQAVSSNNYATIGFNYIGSGSTSNYLSLGTTAATSLCILPSGNVGIGTTAASNLLTVGAAVLPIANSIGTTNLVVWGNICCPRSRLIFSSGGAGLNDFNHCIYNNFQNLDNEGVFDGMKFNAYAGAWFRVGSAGLGTVPITGLYIDSVGKVGIGTTGPTSLLTINNAGAYRTNHLIIRGQEFYTSNFTSTGVALNVGVNRTNNKQLWIMDPDLAINNTNICISLGVINTAGTAYISAKSTDGLSLVKNTIEGSSIILSGGNVGIGTVSPLCRLYTYSNTNTGWDGQGYFGNATLGFVCGAYNGTVLIGGHNAALSAWADITIGASTTKTIIPGYLGIGTTPPSYPLHIRSLVTTGETVGAFLGSGGVGGSATGMSTSLLIDGWGITRGAWGAISDKRIKMNIEPVTNIISIIKQIEVVHYDYINRNEGRDECSVIAQQLQQIFPNAISTQSDTIPNIIKYATHTRTDETITIFVAIDNTVDTQKDIVVGSTLKIYVTGNDHSEREEQSIIRSVDIANGIIVIPVWKTYTPEDKLFVYGTKVHDFLVVDKPQLGIMALQGVKEQQDMIDQQATQIATLESQVEQLQLQVATLIQRLG